MTDTEREVHEAAARAKRASHELAPLARADKDAALFAIADALVANAESIVKANTEDVARAREAGQPEAMIDRLALTTERVEDIADAAREIAELPDPVGEVVRGSTLPNGLELRQVRVPMGVVGVIYEGRPNVTVDAAVLCLKSGNAALLRGSSSAYASNTRLVEVMRTALVDTPVPADAVQLVPGSGRESAHALMRARGLVDVLIPRGGGTLIQSVVTESTVPVIETGEGNCHVYIDKAADLDNALTITLNSKAQRVSVCNAAETLLVHAGIAEDFLPRLASAMTERGVTLHGDERTINIVGSATPATEADWAAEYLAHDLAVRVVDSLTEAVEHIRRYSTGHTEAIVTDSASASRSFVAQVDSAAVMVNASTRFTDGGEFGFGAEIGISTQKLHARGPMGLPEMTSTKYVITGDGQIRS